MHTILIGDAREQLRTLPDQSVACVVTSPPYFGLRDYGTATWEGGDPECDHLRQSAKSRSSSGLDGAKTTQGGKIAWGATCGKCGAIRIDQQIGTEPTVDAYVAALVDVFREVWRVLRDDGTLWLNLGDSYNAHPGQRKTTDKAGPKQITNTASPAAPSRFDPSLKPKDLIGVPWRVAFALQADGWYLRKDNIWHKTNPMPESVTDRTTTSHEYMFHFSKAARYYYDASAIAEPSVRPGDVQTFGGGKGRAYQPEPDDPNFRNGSEQWGRTVEVAANRNKRSVWTVSTTPYSGAHFATFPPKLVEPCILAGTSERGACPVCGAPWVRVMDREPQPKDPNHLSGKRWLDSTEGKVLGRKTEPNSGLRRDHTLGGATIGWAPSCTCDAGPPIPQTVLDPFVGSGTTVMVAERLGRHAIGIDLDPDNAALIAERTAQRPLWDALEVSS